MAKLISKLMLPVSVLCAIFSAVNLNVYAQCAGTYFKPATRKIFTENLLIRSFQDMNGDGKVDLVAMINENESGTAKSYKIYPGDGGGNFGTPTTVNFPATIYAYNPPTTIVDYNSDGKVDIVARVDTNPPSIIVYLNDGSANFTAQTPIVIGDESIQNIFDINGDGRKDIITYQSSPASYRYRLVNTDGSVGAPISLGTASYASAADFNGDGKIDVPYITQIGSSYELRFYYNAGGGVFSSGGNPIELGSVNNLTSVSDLNNDGKLDLIFSSQYPAAPAVNILTNLGNGSFSTYSFETGGSYGYNLNDFNGDGLKDFLLRKTNSYTILTNTGTPGNFTSRTYNRPLTGTPTADFDGDGKTDFLSFSYYNISPNNPNKVFTNESQMTIYKNVCSPFGQTKIIDFDGDGLNDFAFWNPTLGRWRYQPRTDYQAGNSVNFYWGQAGDIAVPGDYDGDSKTDYAVYRPSSGVWYIYQSETSVPIGIQFGASEDKPVPGDYNGDGRTDIAVFRPSNGSWYMLYSGSNQFYGVQFGASEDKPVPEDYDGDGKLDVAVFRPSNGAWYVLQSSNNTYFGVQWGTSTDFLIPADYDGDGKADIAVMRPGATNYTYIRRANGLPSAAYPFGTNGDIPQISDWDNNGFAEIGVYRPSNKVWYLLPVPIYDSVRNAGLESGEQLISTTIKSY